MIDLDELDTGNGNGSTTVVHESAKPPNNGIDTVSNTVELPDFLLILLDQDQLHSHNDYRTDVVLDNDEQQMLEHITKDQGASNQCVLRVALRYLYRCYNRETAMKFHRENRRTRKRNEAES